MGEEEYGEDDEEEGGETRGEAEYGEQEGDDGGGEWADEPEDHDVLRAEWETELACLEQLRKICPKGHLAIAAGEEAEQEAEDKWGAVRLERPILVHMQHQ